MCCCSCWQGGADAGQSANPGALMETRTCMDTSAWRPSGPTARFRPPPTPQCSAPQKAATAALCAKVGTASARAS